MRTNTEHTVINRGQADETIEEEGNDEEREENVCHEFDLQVVHALGEAEEDIRNVMNEEDVATNSEL